MSASPVDPQFPIARQTIGPLTVTKGEQIVVNHENLTTTANSRTNASTHQDWYGSAIDLPNGNYARTISQLTEPELSRTHDGPDFHLQLIPGETPNWTTTAWFAL
ncbi:hypothetical protein JK358_15595 [Nocardia sp. 2]|uniref:Uncharacterized protein n=1 Tax=Nocardia acididurans TaxID=2802282 RepID=A0ABS1M7R4_9NOCA|nr:hypothetical protein [Nocardia acididurans]MBL1075819.1 hypothetical protein [Nocardia acididurans]